MEKRLNPMALICLLALTGLNYACQPEFTSKHKPLDPDLFEQGYRIAFLSALTGNGDLYAIDKDGERMERISLSDSAEFGPRWLWSERKLLFAQNQGDHSSIYELSPGDSSPNLVLDFNPAFEEVPDWDENGFNMVFSQKDERGQNLYRAQPNGQIIEALTQDTFINKQPDFSPDGRSIVFTSNRTGNQDIFTLNIRSLVIKNLTNHPATEGHPKWSPLGDKILFYRYEQDNADLYSMNVDGGEVINLTNSPENELIGSYSPDGKYIAFGGVSDENWEIFVMDSDGSNKKRLTYNDNFDGDPIWIEKEAFDSTKVFTNRNIPGGTSSNEHSSGIAPFNSEGEIGKAPRSEADVLGL